MFFFFFFFVYFWFLFVCLSANFTRGHSFCVYLPLLDILLLLLLCCCFTSTVNIYGHVGTES